MAMLLENQHSIIESTVQMFIAKELGASVRASVASKKKDDEATDLSLSSSIG
jgi:hypothetical protein